MELSLSFLLLVVGLTICFGGIYFRRVSSMILGFLCGVVSVIVFVLVTAGLWSLLDDSTLTIMVVCGLIYAVVCAVYYKVCAAINAFLTSLIVLVVLLLMISDGGIELIAALVIAAVISGIIAYYAAKFFDYAHIITTAVMGAFIASIGGCGLIEGRDVGDILGKALWYGFDSVSGIMIGTVILAAVGIYVQLQRLKKIQAGGAGDSSSGDNSSNISGAAQNVAQQAKQFGDQARAAINDLTDDAAKKELKAAFERNKLLLIAPLITFLVIPIITQLVSRSVSYDEYYYVRIIISQVFEGITVGTFVYFVLNERKEFNLLFAASAAVSFLIFDVVFRVYRYDYTAWSIIVMAAEYPLLLLIMRATARAINNKSAQPVVLCAVAALYTQFVVYWIAYIYIGFYINALNVVMTVMIFITAFVLFNKMKNVNIFKLSDSMGAASNNAQGNTADGSYNPAASSAENAIPKRFCQNCGNKLNQSDVFCPNCGRKL